MGYQISCYLSVQDSVFLEQQLLQLDDSVILKDRSRGPYPATVFSTDLIENENRQYFFYFARRVDLDAIVMAEVPTQGYWSINDLFSPVVEFTLGRFDGEVLRRGRFYYTDSYYDNQRRLIQKPVEFLNWADQVLNEAKRLLTYDRQLQSYLGSEAVEMRKSGIELRQF